MRTLPSWSDLSDDEKIAFFRKHLADGLSFGRMALLVTGATRNTMIGKHNRLAARGIEFPPTLPRGGHVKTFAPKPVSRQQPPRKPRRTITKERNGATPESAKLDSLFKPGGFR